MCKHIIDEIQIGKCEGCNQTVYDINNITDEIKSKMRDYGIKSVPTTIIDSKIKIVGIPDFPWICSEDLYKRLEKDYLLKVQ
ncbi:MAG TPA: thioredoxin family protein [Nitrososphaeraceae archaeon]|nr:thioredoxin family protein [Nitrososphaeraceae archaeon]